MYPINQVFLGGDPLLGTAPSTNSIDEQLQLIRRYEDNLKAMKEKQSVLAVQQQPTKLIWDEIDTEVGPLTNQQKELLFRDEEYSSNYQALQSMVQTEILNLVKGKIEGTKEGQELLSNQLKLVKKLKNKIVEETTKEMDMFRKFKEFAKSHPNSSYEDFIKETM